MMGDVNNSIAVHSLKTGHSIAWDKAKITEREICCQRRRVKEAIRIQKGQVRMKLDQGLCYIKPGDNLIFIFPVFLILLRVT